MTSRFLAWLKNKQKESKKNKCKMFKKNGAGVLVFCPATKRFLVHCRGSAGSNAGQYGLFGGGLDLGQAEASDIDSLEDLVSNDALRIFKRTAERELYEESGFDGKVELKLINIFRDPKCKSQFYNFLGIVEKEFKVNPPEKYEDETDVDKSRWVTWSELTQLKPKHFGLKNIIKSNWENPYF